MNLCAAQVPAPQLPELDAAAYILAALNPAMELLGVRLNQFSAALSQYHAVAGIAGTLSKVSLRALKAASSSAAFMTLKRPSGTE